MIDYDEWRAIDDGLSREERVRDLIVEGEVCDGSAPRWAYWNKKDTKEQWRWLKDLCFYIRRRQVRECTEQLWGPKTEEIEDEIPGSIDGVEERHLNVVDTTKEPRLAITEWGKLKTCERPCTMDEWRGMANTTKWETLGNLGYAFLVGKGIRRKIRKKM